MSMDAILTALDKAQEATIAADLAVLSLTAAAFMATLRTECSQNLKLLEVDLRQRSGDRQIKRTIETEKALEESQASYNKQAKLVEDSTEATRLLLRAFVLFLLNLIGKLWFDPLTKEFIISEIGSSLSILVSESVPPIDILLLGGAPALGIVFLLFGAQRILAVVETDKSGTRSIGSIFSSWLKRVKGRES